MAAGPPDLLERIDRILAELRAIRAAVAAAVPAPAGNGLDADDDFAPKHLIEISTAVSIRKLLADKLGRARPIMT
jgi:hypothetical protein